MAQGTNNQKVEGTANAPVFLSERAKREIRNIQEEPETYKSMLCDSMANLSYLADSCSAESDLKSAADVLTSLRMYWELLGMLSEKNGEGGTI